MEESKIIEFKGMPLFHKARFKSGETMQGEIKDFACFIYMTQGSMVSIDARGAHSIHTRDAIMKSCGNYIQQYFADENSDKCEAIAVYLYPDLLKEIYKDNSQTFQALTEAEKPKRFISNKLIEQYMSNLVIYFEEPTAFDEELGILKLKELMMILLKSENYENIRALLSEIFAPINVQFTESVKQNIFNNLSLTQLAFICNMSLSSFKREFKKVFNDTPARYIKKERLKQAETLLITTDQSISDITFECGFQDVTTFSDSFKVEYGLSPSRYRMNQMRN